MNFAYYNHKVGVLYSLQKKSGLFYFMLLIDAYSVAIFLPYCCTHEIAAALLLYDVCPF
jgi:hypothetical protein